MLKTITVKPDRVTGSEDVVVVPIHKGTRKLGFSTSRLDRTCRSLITDQIKARRFSGEKGETSLLALKLAKAPAHILLLGLGDRKRTSPETIANAGGVAAKALGSGRFKSASVLIEDVAGDNPGGFTHALVKGLALAQYRFTVSEKTPPAPPLRRLVILTEARAAVSAAAERALVVAEHAAIVRDLVNEPADTMTPSELARRARSLCKETGVSCKVIGRAQMEKEKMGAILSVARGSRQDPKLIVMHYNASRKDLPMVCLVGKGVTFDTGGISIKPWNGMNEMKGDMAGGGLVISTIAAAARLELPLQIVGVVPCVENMPGGIAFRPGDIIATYSGKTIEVLTTDAEGRLILADALTYVRKNYKPAVTVDFATLTGAVLIALGTRIAGVMGNSQADIEALVDAGRASGEPVWQLPLDDEFYDAVKGDISDFKNYSGRNGSTITAAALLGKFAGNEPWAHVDIAGTFWSDGGGPSYHAKGATGYGVDLALAFLESVAKRPVA